MRPSSKAGSKRQAPAGWQADADPGAGSPTSDIAEEIRQLVAAKRASLPRQLGNDLAASVARGPSDGGDDADN